MKDTIFGNANRKNLLQLFWLRLIAIFAQILTIIIAHYFLHIALPLSKMLVVVVLLTIINGISFYRYKLQKTISDKSLFIELLCDVAALSTQLYFSGGVSNPFISLFLLQVIISAILLRTLYAWLITMITIICYITLSFYYEELHAFHHQQHGDFLNLHLHGMLISYIFAAILLLIFVTKIIKNLKERDQKINQLKRQSLKKEQVMKMGLLATGAAHELGTPLATICVILSDWKRMDLNIDLMDDIQTIESQVSRCKKIISQILSSSGNIRPEAAKIAPIKNVFDNLIHDWKNSRKPINLAYNFTSQMDKNIILDNVISQALCNIFDNALEASPHFIAIDVNVTYEEIIITTQDRGSGFDKAMMHQIGQAHISTKNSSGLGLFLAINSLDMIDAKLNISNLENGAQVIVTIPLKNL